MAAAAPTRPWWVELGAVVPRSLTFARGAGGTPEVPALSANPLAWATVALDELAVSAAYLVSRRSAEVVSAAAAETAGEAADLLERAGVGADPRLAHPAPGPVATTRVTRRRRMGVDFEHLSFASRYRPPVDIPGSAEWADELGNRTAHVYLLRDGAPGRPWVLVLHGHRMGEPRDLRLMGSVRLQRDLGVNVAHLVLPTHGPRGRSTAHVFPGVDPVRNFLGMSQSVADARAVLQWLRAEGAERVGVYGVSLGGHVTAMLAGLEPGLAAVVAGVPTADLATMLADTMRARWGEEAVAASHVLDDASRRLSRLVSPLAFAPLLPVESRFIYAAVGDRLVTPQQAARLWEHWDRCTILWLQGGHIANNVAASRRFVAESLAGRGVTGRQVA